jgi:hypothetical protein
MLGVNVLLPFLTACAGAAFGLLIHGDHGLRWGAVIGFAVGCAVIIIVWLMFALLKRLTD